MAYVRYNQILLVSWWVLRPSTRCGHRGADLRGSVCMHWYMLCFDRYPKFMNLSVDDYTIVD